MAYASLLPSFRGARLAPLAMAHATTDRKATSKVVSILQLTCTEQHPTRLRIRIEADTFSAAVLAFSSGTRCSRADMQPEKEMHGPSRMQADAESIRCVALSSSKVNRGSVVRVRRLVGRESRWILRASVCMNEEDSRTRGCFWLVMI